MSENNTDGRRIWFIFLLIIFFLSITGVVLAFVIIPGLATEQRLEYGIKALTTIGTIFAGIAVFINAFYAGKNSEALNKSAEAAFKNAVIAEDKQITERFAKAIEQLGSEKIEVRLGAIYTLERIAKDSPKDHWTIMEILTAFLRENTPRKSEEEKTENTQQTSKIRTDIQAALTVIGRRNFKNEQENQRLDLSNIDIRGAKLYGAKLQKANLHKANLQQAFLDEANLQGSELSGANLQLTNLSGAKLQKANLHKANLQAVNLYKANLQAVNLYEANLQQAFLDEANLQGSELYRANLQGTHLKYAKNLEQKQIDSAKGDRTTILPDYLQYPEHWQ